MFTPLITHDLDGAALAAPVDAARRNGAAYKTRAIDDLRIKDDRLRAAIEGTGHLLFDGGMGTMLQAAGMKAVGVNPDTNLVEAVEVENHPWFVGVQYHPELRSRPNRPHPLFREFVGAALKAQEK